MTRFFLLFASIVLAVGVSGNVEPIQPGHLYQRDLTAHNTPGEPTQSGIVGNCNRWYDAVPGDSCFSIEKSFGIAHWYFLRWNPAVSSDCLSGFWAGYSYCVGVGPRSPDVPTSTTTSATKTAETTGPNKPTGAGQPWNCDAWYDVASGDTCLSVEAAFHITHAQFLAWNPAVSEDCSSGFWAGYSYCVEVNPNATSTVMSTTTTSTSVTDTETYSMLPNGTSPSLAPMPSATDWPPSPRQSGILSNCLRYYQAKMGDTCDVIVNHYSHLITMDDFLAWNPAVGENCTGLYIDWYYCIDAPYPDDPLPNATTQWYPGWTHIPPPQSNWTFDPSPHPPGMISTCQNFWQAKPGDTCANVTSYLGYVNIAQFEQWNGFNCNGSLTVGTYYCVANFTAETLPDVPTVSTLPSPVQPGIISSCISWYQATSPGDCSVIPQVFARFSEADFLSWNPALGPNCSGLVVGNYYCVAIPSTPKQRLVQPGISAKCNSLWWVSETDSCTSIAKANNITVADLTTWNPALSPDCSGLKVHYYICVDTWGSLDSTPTTSTGAGTTTSTMPSAAQHDSSKDQTLMTELSRLLKRLKFL